MKASYTYKGSTRVTNVWVEKRADGTYGPPLKFEVSERSCPFSPATNLQLELERYDAESDTAIYRVAVPGQITHTSG
jgi:hypothetical protein